MKPNHEIIYLVPTDYDGGQLTYSWCDCPAPGEGMDPEDATRYVREDIYLALQAQVEQLGNQVKIPSNSDEAVAMALTGMNWLESNDKSKLTEFHNRYASEIKAQAVEEYCASFESMCVNQLDGDDVTQDMADGWKAGVMDCRIAGRKYANQLRQQAKVGE